MLIDSHCHLDLINLSEFAGGLDDVLKNAQANGVRHILSAGVNFFKFADLLALVSKYDWISCSVGHHPNENNEKIVTADAIALYAQNKKVVAIGETGLDYYHQNSGIDWQKDRFINHIHAAHKVNKPLIVHARNAIKDTLDILQQENARDVGVVMHCFTENYAFAKRSLDLGFYISFSGIVTFKQATELQETAKKIPLDRILIETDAPYLAPMPFRGKQNQPAYVKYTAEFLAKLLQIDFAKFAEITTNNFYNLFHKF